MKTISKLNSFKLKPHNTIEVSSKLYFKNLSELNIFRREMGHSHNFYSRTPYSLVKKRTLIYKSIFLGLGLLFILLACFVCLAPISHPLLSLFNHSVAITKKLLIMMAFFGGGLSLFIFYFLKPETEILNCILRKHHNQLSKLHIKKQIFYKIHSIYVFGALYRKKTLLHHHYLETKDKLQELKDTSLQLITYINNSKDIHLSKKELLCNQVILELEEKLSVLIDQFEQINLNEYEN